MRWLSHVEAQSSAFSAPDAQAIAFRLPGHLAQNRVHLLAREAFGHRAEVEREDGSWVIQRRPYDDACVSLQREKQRRRQQQRLARRASPKRCQAVVLVGGL